MVCVTDDERRDVARSLRRMAAKHDGVAGVILENRLGLESDERFLYGSVFTSESVERLADLIDADTTAPKSDASATVTDASATLGMSQTRRSGVDRHALLKLADRIQHHADNAAGHSAYAARFDLAGWAEVIREACGGEQ